MPPGLRLGGFFNSQCRVSPVSPRPTRPLFHRPRCSPTDIHANSRTRCSIKTRFEAPSGAVYLWARGQWVWALLTAGLGCLFLVGAYQVARTRWGLNASCLCLIQGDTQKLSIPWKDVASIRFRMGELVIASRTGKKHKIPHTASGLGALAMHVDEHCPVQIEIDERAQALLLQEYRVGLIEAEEDPDSWIAARQGCLTLRATSPL